VSAVPRAAHLSLSQVYGVLRRTYGHRGWWPARSPFEVAVGAILVQGVTWAGAARAIAALEAAGLLAAEPMARASPAEVASHLRPARFPAQKARALVAFAAWLAGRGGDLASALAGPWPASRRTLLGLSRIGPETADVIGLYALGQPVVVADAHTERVLRRLGLYGGPPSYAALQSAMQAQLASAPEVDLGDLHAQLDHLGHTTCRLGPRCDACPLRPWCPTAMERPLRCSARPPGLR
jgi:endonuclease-3 related protein